jgi:predicted phage tail protein|tara:strand:+ start:390 stop:1052 length:663 start_codon:yes stop_codon:yes gene_type:complete
MTTIKLHGLLAKEYQDQFVLNIVKPQDVVRAIDCNRKGFLKRFNELKRQGLHYDIIVDRGHISKKIKQVDLVPVIVGAATLVTGIAGIFGGGALATAGAAVAVGAGAAMLGKALKPKPEQRPDVGGTAATDTSTPAQDEPVTFQSRAAVASMVFNNVANIASQGDPVPIGYGRLKIGSSVVQATIKSFPMSHKTSRAFNQNPFNVEGQVDVMQEIYTAGD